MWTKWISRFMALVWTGMVVFMLMRPSDSIGPRRPFFTLELTPVDMWEAFGHVIIFSILTFLWQRAFAQDHSPKRAMLMAASLAVLLGAATEAGQYFVWRSVLLLDLSANFAGIGLIYLVYLATAAFSRGMILLVALIWTGMVVFRLMTPIGRSAPARPFLTFKLTPGDMWRVPAYFAFFGVMTFLWQRAFAQGHSPQRAALMATGLTVLLSGATEAGQQLMGRGALLIDLIANSAAIGLVGLVYLGKAELTGWIFRLVALAWMGLVVFLLLRPDDSLVSARPLVSFELTRSTVRDGIGFVIVFVVFTYLLQGVFAQHYDRQRAVLMAASLAVLLGVASEVWRFSMQRDVLLVDLLASFVGVGFQSFAHLVTGVFPDPNGGENNL